LIKSRRSSSDQILSASFSKVGVSITVLINFNCTGFQYYVKENKKIRGSKAAKVVKTQS
jgi:hypothetical protein